MRSLASSSCFAFLRALLQPIRLYSSFGIMHSGLVARKGVHQKGDV